MRDSEIFTLANVATALEEYLPVKKCDLYKEYLTIFEALLAKHDKQKQRYMDKAEYHRESTRQWRQNNKEKNREYQREYARKKAAEKKDNTAK